MPSGTDSIMSSKSGTRARMRTYANRVRKDSLDSPAKRVCIEVTIPLPDIAKESPVALSSPGAKRKRSIADFFTKPPTSANPSSPDSTYVSHQPQEKTHSSSPPLYDTPPSSPPPLKPHHTYIDPPIRKRRRLNTRPQAIKPSKMEYLKDEQGPASDGSLNQSSSSEESNDWEHLLIEGYNRSRDDLYTTTPAKRAKGTGRVKSYTAKEFEAIIGSPPTKTKSPIMKTFESINRAKNRAAKEAKNKAANEAKYKAANKPINNSRKGGRLTVRDCIIEDGSLDESGRQDPNEYIVTSEDVKGGVRFIETLVTKEPKEPFYPGQIPISGRPVAREKDVDTDTDSDSSSKIETTSEEPSPVLPAGFVMEMSPGKEKKKTKTGKLVQTQINLGKNPVTTCDECKFHYNSTDVHDIKAHMRAHNDFVNPFRVNKLKFDGPRAPKKIKTYMVDSRSEYIIGIDALSPEAWRKLVEKVIRHVEDEFNAKEISSDELWSTMVDPGVTVNNTSVVSDFPVKRFKAYAYVADERIACLLLAERVTGGLVARYGPTDVDEHGKRICGEGQTHLYPKHTDELRKAVLGVHYIWTSPDYRSRGYATRLLDAARHGDFIYGLHVYRHQLAWTATTTAGRSFAGWYAAGEKKTGVWETILY